MAAMYYTSQHPRTLDAFQTNSLNNESIYHVHELGQWPGRTTQMTQFRATFKFPQKHKIQNIFSVLSNVNFLH